MANKIFMKRQIILLSLILLTSGLFAQPGTLDLTFGGNGFVTTNVGNGNDKGTCLAIQNDNKIIVAGASTGNLWDFALVRYNIDGSLDSSFGTNGKVRTPMGVSSNDIVYSVAVQNDNKIIVAGTSSKGSVSDFALARYNVDGSLDLTFGTGGRVITDLDSTYDEAFSLALQDDGKIVVTGSAVTNTVPDIGITRYNVDGSLDFSFGTNGVVITHIGNSSNHTQAASLKIQTDGKIVIIGSSQVFNWVFTIARYNPDGTLDVSFGSNGIVTTSFPNVGNDYFASDGVLQDDGKLVLVGCGEYSSLPPDFCVARYNIDGSLDTLFGTSGLVETDASVYTNYAYSVALDSDKKIIVAGGSGYSAPNAGFEVVRYNTNGIIDSTFGSNGIISTHFGSGTNNCALDVAMQYDDKIIVAGWSSDSTGQLFAVARYYNRPLGIKNFISDDNYFIYPNPSSNFITIIARQSFLTQDAELLLYNIQGQLILQQLFKKEKPTIDISNFPKGMYIIKLIDNDNTFVTKIIKE